MFLLALLLPFAAAQSGTPGHRKFEYKYSFRGPNLAQRDGSVPFWDVQGDAMASSEQIRLAPSMRSKKGLAVTKKAFTAADDFIIDFTFKVTGQGRVGADGLAFWYTAQPALLGTVFGAGDFWTGLGIFFDSFDNDAQRNNPYISMMVNDGTRSYDHQTDGSRQMITGCQKDFRNRPFPVKMRIEYVKNVITVFIHDGMTQQDRFELCMRAENIFLPKGGYFALSAATGGLAGMLDDHDVLSFSVFSILSQQPSPPGMIPPEEEKKFQKEFEDQWKNFEEEKQKFAKEHPDKVKHDEDDFDKFFEDATQRELRLIYESQNSIHNILATLETKLERVVQAQNQHTHLLNTVSGGKAVAPAVGGQAPPVGGGGGDGIQRHETTELLQLSRDVSAAVREMKTYVSDIYSRTINVEAKVNSGGAQAGQGVGTVQAAGGYEAQQMRHHLEGIKADIEAIRTNQNKPGSGGGIAGCPDQNCLKPTMFMIAVVAQGAILIACLLFFRKGNDKAKFY